MFHCFKLYFPDYDVEHSSFCFYELSPAYFSIVLFLFLSSPHPQAHSSKFLNFAVAYSLPYHGPQSRNSCWMEFGILSTSEYVTDPLAEPSGAKLVLISGLCFGLLPPEPQVVSLRFLFPIFFQAWRRRGAPSQSLASECENGSTPLDFMKLFHILLPSLFWPHSLLAFCPVSIPWDNYHGLEPDKHFVFQFLYFIITMDVEQKG